MNVCDITTFQNWNKLEEINFTFSPDKFGYKHCENIITFDIETTSATITERGVFSTRETSEGEPVAFMYQWQCAVENNIGKDYFVFGGRTYDDYKKFMHYLSTVIRTSALFGKACKDLTEGHRQMATGFAKVKCFIYVHNLGFEFQFLRNIFQKEFAKKRHNRKHSVFARTMRKPMSADCWIDGIEYQFRDTLVLTQKSLASWAKDEKLPVQKLKGDLDYDVIRTPFTPLTEQETQYCLNDVIVMVHGIDKYRQIYGSLKNIPRTQTGTVRLKCIDRVCAQRPDWAEYCYNITQSYTYEIFSQLMNAFAGGWTHANARYTGILLKNIHGYDFASSYPAVMCMKRFPIGPLEVVDEGDYENYINEDVNSAEYRFMIDVTFEDIKSKLDNTFWSSSRTTEAEGITEDNGKIYSAKMVRCTLTDLDFELFRKCYSVKKLTIHKMWRSKAGRLPKEMVELILDYYAGKTSLKGLADRLSKYNESKQFINSIYGCFVMKLVSDIINFEKEGWSRQEVTKELFDELLSEAGTEGKTFTTYQIGVWVTAWARHNLWDAILHFDRKCVYCDTDSIKIKNETEADRKWFEDYNNGIRRQSEQAAAELDIDTSLYRPKTQKGIEKPLGIFADDGFYLEFKTLGAKRYCLLTEENEIELTVAGLPKREGVKKITKVDDFKNNMKWAREESGKLMAIYNENQKPFTITGTDGNPYLCKDKYAVCLSPIEFNMSTSPMYDAFIDMMYGEGDCLNHDPI